MIKANKKKAALACGTALALSIPVVAEARGCGWSSCGGRSLVPHRRNYYYNRPSRFDLLGDIFSTPIYFNSLHRQSEAQRSRMERSAPRYEMHEGPNGGVELTLEVPGVEAKDLSVELEDGNVLRIRGSRQHHQRGSTVESKFEQMFRMDDNVDIENLSVTLSSGVLRISAPQKEKVVRKIPVESLEVEDVVAAKVLGEETSEDAEIVDANLVKDLNQAQAKSQDSVDGLTMTEEDM